MNSIEEIRQTIFSTFKALHDASFPSIQVNWPNYSTVDIENLAGAFVSVQLSFNFATEVFDITSLDDIVRGELLISYLRPTNTGATGSAAYSDMLRANLCYKDKSGIHFGDLSILEVSPAPGCVGQMNVIKFMV